MKITQLIDETRGYKILIAPISYVFGCLFPPPIFRANLTCRPFEGAPSFPASPGRVGIFGPSVCTNEIKAGLPTRSQRCRTKIQEPHPFAKSRKDGAPDDKVWATQRAMISIYICGRHTKALRGHYSDSKLLLLGTQLDGLQSIALMKSYKIQMKKHFAAGWIALLIVVAPFSEGLLRGQQQPEPKIAVEVKVVNVLATVRDKHGKIVPDLNKDDFAIAEDGHPQTITYFLKETDLPLTLGLLVDTSLSQRRVLGQERTASHSFLDDMLRPEKDKAFVIHFDHEVELLQDLTSSRDELEKSLDLLETPEMNQQGGGSRGGGGRGGGGSGGGGSRQHFGGAGTLLYDAVFLASDEVIKKQQGRKALIILSDGDDRGSKETVTTAIATAQRADTVVYSILFADDQESHNRGSFGGPGMGRHGGGGGGQGRYPQQGDRTDGKKILERISKETGGRMFEVSKKESIEQIYKTIAEELRNQYSIGYTPAADVAAGYHKIAVTTKQKDLTVQARDGYYATQQQPAQ